MATPESMSEASTSALQLTNVSSQSQACNLLICAIQHLLYAKGQIYEPFAILQAKRARERLAESQQKSRDITGAMGGAFRRKSMPFEKRRRLRKTDEVSQVVRARS
jgi:hypothetical protein